MPSIVDAGEQFFEDLLEEEEEHDSDDDASVSIDDEPIDDDASLFSTQTVGSSDERDIYGNQLGPSGEDSVEDDPAAINENLMRLDNAHENSTAPDPVDDDPLIPRERSIAHHCFTTGKAVLLSLDIEHAGEFVGVVQLSGELCRLDLIQKGTSARSDTAVNVRRHPVTFNKYIKPDSEMEWDHHCVATHGLTPNDARIQDADNIRTVWLQFCLWIVDQVARDETVVLVAYNGNSCDLKWLWKLTQAPGSQLEWPRQIQFFMDPLQVIKSYVGCQINPNKSKLKDLELGTVWKYLNDNRNLNGVHDSLVNVRAQPTL